MQAGNWLGRLGALAIAGSMAMPSPAASGSIIEGVWLTRERSELTIAPCQQGYCGYITKIVVPAHIVEKYGSDLEAIGTQFTDYNNKDPNLRHRPIQGLQILTLRDSRNPAYFEGEVYNPEDGNIYAGSVEVISANDIKLKGCVLFVLCQEQFWTRVR